jgi:hypothetical protein
MKRTNGILGRGLLGAWLCEGGFCHDVLLVGLR